MNNNEINDTERDGLMLMYESAIDTCSDSIREYMAMLEDADSKELRKELKEASDSRAYYAIRRELLEKGEHRLYTELKAELVANDDFYMCDGTDYGLTNVSLGICELLKRTDDFKEIFENIVKRFASGDLGEFIYQEDREISELMKEDEAETGYYRTSYGYIEIFRDGDETTARLPFER